VSVRIRMKKMGRTHRPFYRVCAVDKHSPRDGRVLEELGTYDTSVADTDARAVLMTDRIDYWLSVGAQPSEKVAVLIKKYGTNGTHKSLQEAALEKLAQPKVVPSAGVPVSLPKKEEEAQPEETKPEEAKAEAPAAEEAAAAPEAAATEEATVEAAAPEAAAEEETPKEQADAPSE
jgi:small subunit ribosomal protein S16